jgi:hypothetical protein
LLNPRALHFGAQNVRTASAAQAIHIANVGLAALIIARVSITGANPGDFSTAGTCAGETIAVYGGCTITIRFTPRLPGSRRAQVVIVDNAINAPQTVALSGVGTVVDAQRTTRTRAAQSVAR